MSIEDDKTPIVEIDYGPATSRFQLEKPVKGKIISDEPLARGFGTPTDNSQIGQERAKIIQWEKSIESLREKIEKTKELIKLSKDNIKDYERAAIRKEKQLAVRRKR